MGETLVADAQQIWDVSKPVALLVIQNDPATGSVLTALSPVRSDQPRLSLQAADRCGRWCCRRFPKRQPDTVRLYSDRDAH